MNTLKSKYLYTKIIDESAKTNYFIREWYKSLELTKLNKEQITKMLSNIESMNVLKDMSDYFYEVDGPRYIAYQPNDDDFINRENKESIVNKIAEYLFKFICN
ncbi:MAG: hypothetical protein J6D03_00050 [Clostridia bacterium]|nr:hypothetical protein [Clostridia bacterium]